MTMVRTYIWICAAMLIGWASYTTYNILSIYHTIHGATYADTYYMIPMPNDISALMQDITSEPMPHAMPTEGTIAADMLDQYIMIGDVFHDFSSDIQKFVMAHEMAHYREKHHTHDILIQSIYVPLLLLILIISVAIVSYFGAHATLYRWIHGWLTGTRHICTRTFSLHAHRIQKSIYYTIQTLAFICITAVTACMCEAVHVYSANGFNQYIEYRSDITAICQTCDAQAPCALFIEDDQNPDTHPCDPNRRAYIYHCQECGFRPHTWYEAAHVLTLQQLWGCLLFAATKNMPIPYIADEWIPYISCGDGRT